VPKAEEKTDQDQEFENFVLKARENAVELIEKDFDVTKALNEIFSIFDKANKYIDSSMPWNLAKDESSLPRLKTVIYNLLESIVIGTKLLHGFMPISTQKVLEAFGQEKDKSILKSNSFGELKEGTKIEMLPVLFPRLDIEKEKQKLFEIANK
jgi:methionyl-tRNA synthetase